MLCSVEDDNERLRSRINALESENEELKAELQKWITPKVGAPGTLMHQGTGCPGLFQSCCDANPNEPPGIEAQQYYDISPQGGPLGFGLFSCCQNVAITQQRPVGGAAIAGPSGHGRMIPGSGLQKAGSGSSSHGGTGGGETSALIPIGQIGHSDSMTATTSSMGNLERMRTITKKSENVDFDGRLVCFRKNTSFSNSAGTGGPPGASGEKSTSCGGIQFERELGEPLSLSVALNTLPSESGCFLGFAPRNVDFKESPFAPSKGYYLYVRHQTLYAQDGTIGQEFSTQKFLLLSCQKLALHWDANALVIRLVKDGQHLGECRFDTGSVLPKNVGDFLPTILFGSHDTTLTLSDD